MILKRKDFLSKMVKVAFIFTLAMLGTYEVTFGAPLTDFITNLLPSQRAKDKSFSATRKISTSSEGIEIKIKNPEFTLRTFKEKDIKFLTSLYQTPSLMKTATVRGEVWKDEIMSHLVNYWKNLKKNSPFTAYVLKDKQTKQPIGIFEFIPESDHLELFYMIAPSAQGKGWGSTLIKTVMQELVPIVQEKNMLKNFVTLVGYALKDNFSSLKMLKNAGFLPNHSVKDKRFPENWQRFEYKIG